MINLDIAHRRLHNQHMAHLTYIMMRAELEGIICSGARRGKRFTYALLAERAPQAKMLARDEALAELTIRYCVSHDRATIQDFVWWSGQLRRVSSYVCGFSVACGIA